MSLRALGYWSLLYFMTTTAACNAADCDISVSQPVVNYGHISVTDFSASKGSWNALDPHEVIVSTQCSEPVQISNVLMNAGIGKKISFGKNSVVTLTASNAFLDGKPVNLAKDTAQGAFRIAKGGKSRELVFSGDNIIPVVNGKVPMGQQFVYRLTIKPLINRVELNVSDQDQIESNITATVLFQ